MSQDSAPQANAPVFDPLPGWGGTDGARRRVGVEIEFGGLTEVEAAEIAVSLFGGRIDTATGGLRIADSALGRLEIYLDTALRKTEFSEFAEAGRGVIPVEIVTAPLDQADLGTLDRLIAALRQAGATGTEDGVLLGFGLHLNPELADPGGADLPAVGRAYAFLEPWLRARDPIDLSRRVLPFTAPYPAAYLDALADLAPDPGPETFAACYLTHIQGRNHGLDLLPAIAHLWPGRIEASLGAISAVSARPAYHYRLPDSRIGTPGWSLAEVWTGWGLVERTARRPDLLADLAQAWADRSWLARRAGGDWATQVETLLTETGGRT